MRQTQHVFLVCIAVCGGLINCGGAGDGRLAGGGSNGQGGSSSTGVGGVVSIGSSTSTRTSSVGTLSAGGSLTASGGTRNTTARGSTGNTASSDAQSGGDGHGGSITTGDTQSGSPAAGVTHAAGTKSNGGTASKNGGTAGKSGGSVASAGTAGSSGAPSSACAPPASYRNLFAEILGKTEDEVTAKVNKSVQQLFHGADDQKIYYELEADRAQIYDTGSGDVRSEGQSYGMMMAVQMNMRTEFDKLWNYAASCMRQANGTFTWSMQQGACSAKQSGFAPDGEEYFAMALLLASRRWDTSTGIDYAAEAKKVLKTLATQDEFSKNPACVFYTQNSGNSDASYVLPLFYTHWACFDAEYGTLWDAAANHARKTFFRNACNKQTGLASERSALDGTPQDDFGPDSWRVPMNIMMDFNLNGADAEWQANYAKIHAAFWVKEGLTTYGSRYSLSGEKKDPNHGPGQDGVNAMLAFALPAGDANAKTLLQRAWDVPMQTGQYRYYNGCLQVLSLLHTSGKFRLFF